MVQLFTAQILKKISPSFFRHCVVPKDLFGWWSVGLGVFFLLDSHQYMHNVSFSNFWFRFIVQIILPEKREKNIKQRLYDAKSQGIILC